MLKLLLLPLLFSLMSGSAIARGHGSSHSGGHGSVHVNGYMKSNGTYVAPYTRSAPGYGTSNYHSARGSYSANLAPTTSPTTASAPQNLDLNAQAGSLGSSRPSIPLPYGYGQQRNPSSENKALAPVPNSAPTLSMPLPAAPEKPVEIYFR